MLLVVSCKAMSQTVASDTIFDSEESILSGQVVETVVDSTTVKHSPRKAAMYSAVLPGLGQIYNKKWWKVPIVYGGFVGIGFGISYYQNGYKDSKQAYYDITDDDPETNSYEDLFEEIDFSDESNMSWAEDRLEYAISQYRNYRDLWCIVGAGFYLLNILDANVDAHLIDFDVSEDLSLNVKPLPYNPIANQQTVGLTLTMNF